jgi:hypothetical protein
VGESVEVSEWSPRFHYGIVWVKPFKEGRGKYILSAWWYHSYRWLPSSTPKLALRREGVDAKAK